MLAGGNWLAQANNYRLLFEPIDIANYYRAWSEDTCDLPATHGPPWCPVGRGSNEWSRQCLAFCSVIKAIGKYCVGV